MSDDGAIVSTDLDQFGLGGGMRRMSKSGLVSRVTGNGPRGAAQGYMHTQ